MPGRMSKRMSQAPRLSIVMAGLEEGERKGLLRDFFANHVKTLVTLLMIMGTLLCIILIVMVHKWRFENEQADQIQACLDVAVVGAGISGTYAAWRLRYSGLRVHVFEMSDRVGGRFYTRHFSEFPGVNAELGALYYLPQSHPRLNRTIHALRLQPHTSPRPNRVQRMYYLRGRDLLEGDLKDGHFSMPYRLDEGEKYRDVEELKTKLFTDVLLDANDSVRFMDPLKAKTKDNIPLYKQSLWNVLGRSASWEALNYLGDATPWRMSMANGNAALMASFNMGAPETHMTVKEGMDRIPNTLLDEFLNASTSNQIYYNKRLACVKKAKFGLYTLTMALTTTEHGISKDIYKKEDICARNIIIALPQKSLDSMKWKRFGDDETDDFLEDVNSVEPIPAMTGYFMYNQSWWKNRNHKLQKRDVITDMPIKRVRYWGEEKRAPADGSGSSNNERRHLFEVASVQGPDMDYFDGLVDHETYDGAVKLSCNYSMRLVESINSQVAKVFDDVIHQDHKKDDVVDIPLPSSVLIHDWRQSPSGAGWYAWKRGVHWDRVAKRMYSPFQDEKVYIVGSTYCPGQCQFWAEGALKTVDEVLDGYFKL